MCTWDDRCAHSCKAALNTPHTRIRLLCTINAYHYHIYTLYRPLHVILCRCTDDGSNVVLVGHTQLNLLHSGGTNIREVTVTHLVSLTLVAQTPLTSVTLQKAKNGPPHTSIQTHSSQQTLLQEYIKAIIDAIDQLQQDIPFIKTCIEAHTYIPSQFNHKVLTLTEASIGTYKTCIGHPVHGTPHTGVALPICGGWFSISCSHTMFDISGDFQYASVTGRVRAFSCT